MQTRGDAGAGPVGHRVSLTAYAAARLLDAAGLTILALDMAEITNLAGGDNGALLTGAVLACCPLVSALFVLIVPRVASRWGVRRTLALAVTAAVSSNALAVVGLFLGLPALPIVIVLAVTLGVWEAFFYSLGPIVARSYFGIEMAQAYSRTRILVVLGFALAGFSAGWVIHAESPGYGIAAAVVLTTPLAIVLWCAKPAQEPTREDGIGMSPSAQLALVRTNERLRNALIVAVAAALFIYPMATLIIPITNSLHEVSVITGAGALLASQALGSLAAPGLIRRWTTPPQGSNLQAAIKGTFMVGGALILFALANLALSSTVELAVWGIVGLVFGAGLGVASSAGVGAVTDSVSAGQAVEAVGSRGFVVLIALPVGLVAWGGLLSFTSIEVALAVAAAGLMAIAVALLRRSVPSHVEDGSLV